MPDCTEATSITTNVRVSDTAAILGFDSSGARAKPAVDGRLRVRDGHRGLLLRRLLAEIS